jgi:hypothetical protein
MNDVCDHDNHDDFVMARQRSISTHRARGSGSKQEDPEAVLENAVFWADEVRSLTENVSGALRNTLIDLASVLGDKHRWCLMGGLAAGFHSQPRGTQDVDIAVAGEAELDNLVETARNSGKFKKSRAHALVHKESGVEVELITHEHVKCDADLLSRIIDTAISVNLGGTPVPVASREGVVASKLLRGSYMDLADIQRIIESDGPVDLSGFDLSTEQLTKYNEVEKIAMGS